jgi:hypothetical protein
MARVHEFNPLILPIRLVTPAVVSTRMHQDGEVLEIQLWYLMRDAVHGVRWSFS